MTDKEIKDVKYSIESMYQDGPLSVDEYNLLKKFYGEYANPNNKKQPFKEAWEKRIIGESWLETAQGRINTGEDLNHVMLDYGWVPKLELEASRDREIRLIELVNDAIAYCGWAVNRIDLQMRRDEIISYDSNRYTPDDPKDNR